MTELKKELSLYGLTMVAIGSCIGSGIFLTPSQIAGHLPAPLPILLVWAVGGIITLTGALTFAELGAMFPQAGGVYVYLKEAYGGLFGFLYGWVYLVVITSGANAALSIAWILAALRCRRLYLEAVADEARGDAVTERTARGGASAAL